MDGAEKRIGRIEEMAVEAEKWVARVDRAEKGVDRLEERIERAEHRVQRGKDWTFPNVKVCDSELRPP
jgi:hypothetical protein